MSWLNDYLSRSYLGIKIPGASTTALLRARIKHTMGYCQIVVGFTKTEQEVYTPLAKCWMCGRESTDDLPTAAEILRYEAMWEKLKGESKIAPGS